MVNPAMLSKKNITIWAQDESMTWHIMESATGNDVTCKCGLGPFVPAMLSTAPPLKKAKVCKPCHL